MQTREATLHSSVELEKSRRDYASSRAKALKASKS
jgi:hypothetical protein